MKTARRAKTRLFSNKLLAIAFAVCSLLALGVTLYKEFRIPEPIRQILPLPGETISLYLPAGAHSLVQRRIEARIGMADREKADIIIGALRKEKVLPDSVALHDFSSGSDGTLYLNLSGEIKDATLTPLREILVTYAIVNSFTASFGGSRRVQLLVDGGPAYTLNGAAYTYMPLEFSKEIVEE